MVTKDILINIVVPFTDYIDCINEIEFSFLDADGNHSRRKWQKLGRKKRQ